MNIIYCGVGGQGIVLMSNIVGEACARKGIHVVSGELHGLSQRSGSVIVHQRIGRGLSPLIPYGEADVILALEPMEALRYLYFLKPGGTVITNMRIIHHPYETEGFVKGRIKEYVTYDEIIGKIRDSGAKLYEIDALKLAEEAGTALAQNVVLVGALSALPGFPIDKETMLEAVKASVPERAVEANIKAFELGYEAMKALL
ncbi:indolepyruvate ferredoxin oxidoreductase subunit beta [Thermococcus argininiproducens]|uniref:Indolepyruvate ferredoxin oxidoreductase subunit beta n=1 Tax=Thermococcus argininiproducens TaxID=2866384 RepID=A0A9E7MA37_9EURY|nr:indolepyruvate ferredoxin oxidoreductase subunit beta [Thermococcus argininiproducens]USH00165.1 indolepyruvate ferredoxin oxidoreductase subunit beta [Thermococcus argininiproducens]